MHHRWIFTVAVAAIWSLNTAGTWALDLASVNDASFGGARTKKLTGFDPVLIKAQVLLDRAGYSPGEIDGRPGENVSKAIAEFAGTHSLNGGGKLDARVWSELAATSSEPVLIEYAISEKDVQGPFVKHIPSKMEEMKDLDQLAYTSPVEAIAEKFHMGEPLLKALNPGKSLDRSGESIVVANVNSRPPNRKVTRIEIDKRRRILSAFDRDGNLVGVFPATIGSAEKPAPSGTYKVTGIAQNPTYRYNPEYHFKGVSARQPFTIKPGPNNPVGVVWIALSAKGYGIHGTPEPSKVSKTSSHGCIRLTNWDAETLAAMVEKGASVTFLG
jgi:lipoprotein-anchoring transpeptidase ErfK/SrfK